uniref:Uncharacterized protein n=1 Tax=Physcomitrium patens TaxID=3218 RepID=A0A2K1KWG3_PHYPA|nr:hypothetical protein PHYPA_005103 [Physcomitrium patens]
MKFKIEELWELKKGDYGVLSAVWNCVYNSIFFHVGACKTANEAWLTFENNHSISDIVT